MQFKILKYMCCGVLLSMSSVIYAENAQYQINESQGGDQFTLRKSVIAAGGKTVAGPYRLHSAIGQSITAKSTSTTYQLTSGIYQQNRDLIFFNEFESNP